MVLPTEAMEHLQQHLGWIKGKRKEKAWLVIWFATVWNIWTARNRKVFQDEVINVEKILDNIKFSSWKWLKGRKNGFHASLYDWSLEPMLCL